MKRFLLLLIGVVLLVCSSLVSCTYNAVFLLSEEDLEWFEPYQDGDVVLFSAVDGRVDTMIVTKNIHNTPGIGLPCLNFHGGGEYVYIIHHQGNSFECNLAMLKDSTSIAMCFNRRFSSDELQVGDTTEVIVKGHVYYDAIIVDDRNSFITLDDLKASISDEADTNCEYFFWSKSKGLLQYKYLNGEVYTYYKKLPRKK